MSKNEKTISIKRLLHWLWSNSRGVRKQAAANTAIGLLDVVCQLLWVLACKHAIDIATGIKEGALSTTGIAGPLGATENKPVGLVYIGVADRNTQKAYRFEANPLLYRRLMKYAFANKALDLLLEFLKENY